MVLGNSLMIAWSEIENKLCLPAVLPENICSRCILPITEINPIIGNGCSECKRARQAIDDNNKLAQKNLQIKRSNSDYDCIVGVSGGVDSSFLLHEICKRNLRPYVMHIDNGWNTSLASNNIHKILNHLGLNLNTVVLDWNEFKQMQIALMAADVIDFEVATDHLIFSQLYRASKKFGGIPICQGINVKNENTMQPGLIHNKHDAIYLKHIYFKKWGLLPKKLQMFSNISVGLHNLRYGNAWVPVLNIIDYSKDQAEKLLINKYDYLPPKRKHEESLITKIYQRIIMPIKFNNDKRLGHLSSLVNSKQIDRDIALKKAQEPHYESLTEIKNDIRKFCNYLEIDQVEFLHYLSRNQLSHSSYFSDQIYVKPLLKLKNGFR